MVRKILLLALTLILAVLFFSCDRDNSKTFNTNGLRQFVKENKENGDMSYDKTKKAYKSVFPNMKMK